MELFPPLTRFYEAIENDVKINTTHISVYMALLQHWNLAEGQNPLLVKRNDIMNAAKINSRSTYNKCMNSLQEFGYIVYHPSNDSTVGSIVILKGI